MKTRLGIAIIAASLAGCGVTLINPWLAELGCSPW
jgi:hypothetical protein